MTEEKAFLLMEEQGWHPMPCDTPVPVYDVPASCGLPLPLGNETNDFKMVPKGILASMDTFFVRAKGDSMITPHKVSGPGIKARGIPRGTRATRMRTGIA